jgi:hypothetical protein
MTVVFRAMANIALATAAEGLACDDSITDLEAGVVAAETDDSPSTFMGGGYGKLDWEDALEVL